MFIFPFVDEIILFLAGEDLVQAAYLIRVMIISVPITTIGPFFLKILLSLSDKVPLACETCLIPCHSITSPKLFEGVPEMMTSHLGS